LTLQIQVYHPFDSSLQESVSQKKIKNRNNNLQDRKVRRLCSDYHYELAYLWNTDPDRKDKEIYDSGEVVALNEQYEMDAVRRDMKKNALVRVRTGKYVVWSELQGKWIDSE
jgi:hypothetical protein